MHATDDDGGGSGDDDNHKHKKMDLWLRKKAKRKW